MAPALVRAAPVERSELRGRRAHHPDRNSTAMGHIALRCLRCGHVDWSRLRLVYDEAAN